MFIYFVFVTAPNVPVFIQGIFRDFHEAQRFAKKADGYRTIRKLPLTDWNFGPLPEFKDTESIGRL